MTPVALSEQSPPQRDAQGRWLPGQSVRVPPRLAVRYAQAVREHVARHAHEVVDAMREIALSASASPLERVAAARVYLSLLPREDDTQPHVLDAVAGAVRELGPDEVRAIARAALAAR